MKKSNEKKESKKREKININVFNSLFPDDLKFKTKKEEDDDQKLKQKNKYIPYQTDKNFYAIFRMEKIDPEKLELRKKYLNQIFMNKNKKILISPPKFALKPIKKKPKSKDFKLLVPSNQVSVSFLSDIGTRRTRTRSLASKKSEN